MTDRTKGPSDGELIGGTEKVEIRLVDYQSAWREHFEALACRIRSALQEGMIGLEHIGSTSVPGLSAKPIIDIMLVVADSDSEQSYVPALKGIGYELRVRQPGHRMLRTPGRDVHVHVYSVGSTEIERCLAFRDQLRADPGDRERYGRLKRELVGKGYTDMNAYAAAKSRVIEEIIARGMSRK